MDRNTETRTIIPREEAKKVRFTSQVNDLFDCDNCTGIFKEGEVAVVNAVIGGVKDIFLLCKPCSISHGVKNRSN